MVGIFAAVKFSPRKLWYVQTMSDKGGTNEIRKHVIIVMVLNR